MALSTSDLAAIGTPRVIEELDYEATLTAIKGDFAARATAAGLAYDVAMLEFDPVVILLQTAAYREMVLRARVNDAARSNLLAFAAGTDLDHVGANASPPVLRMPGEDDERFRLRILLTTQARNVGSDARYRLIALNSSSQVKEAVAYRLGRDPRVYVAITSTDAGGVATQALIDDVTADFYLPDNHLTNGDVTVVSAVTQQVGITATVKLLPGTPATVIAALAEGLRAAWLAEGGLGRDLTRDWVKARLMQPYVYSAAISEPAADLVQQPYQAVTLGEVTIVQDGEAI